jgi:uncharacterized protein YkvS
MVYGEFIQNLSGYVKILYENSQLRDSVYITEFRDRSN